MSTRPFGVGRTVLALSAAVALGACDRAEVDPRALPPLVRVTVPSQAGGETREFTGIIAARVQSDLGFRVGGRVISRLVNTGDTIRRGQALMRLDPNDLALAARAAAAAMEAARARAVQTAADERRIRGLVQAGAISASAADQITAAADAARAQLASAEAQANVARNAANYATLLADADGTVVETLAEPGQVVNAGQIVVRLARSGPREALVQLPETLRPAIGSRAQARTYAGARGAATLRQLSDAANPALRTFEARYVLTGDAAGAPLGSTVSVTVALPGDAGAIELPLGAILDTGKGPGVWVIRQGAQPAVTWRAVRIAQLGEETVTITSGLARGERIVAMGAHMLRENQSVRVAAQ